MYFFSLLIGYLFGSFQTSYILSTSIKGKDIRTLGSKNAGTSNMVQTFGWKLGALTLLGDVLKIIIPLIIAKHYFNMGPLPVFLMGVSGVLGHNFPFYLKFRGGKGTATTLGMLLIFDYKVFLVFLAVLIMVAIISDYIALASLVSVTTIPLTLYLLHNSLYIISASAVLSAVCVYVHRSNIKNILSKRENKISSVFKKGDISI